MRKILDWLMAHICRLRRIADRADASLDYMTRAYLFGGPDSWCFLAIHKIHKSDSDAHLHSHPFKYIALQLSGEMLEVQPEGMYFRTPGYFRYRSRSSLHRLVLAEGCPVYSLFFGFWRSGSWGFDVNGRIVDHRDYLA